MLARSLREGASCPSEDGESLAVWTPPSVGLARCTAHGAGGDGRGGRAWGLSSLWLQGLGAWQQGRDRRYGRQGRAVLVESGMH